MLLLIHTLKIKSYEETTTDIDAIFTMINIQ